LDDVWLAQSGLRRVPTITSLGHDRTKSIITEYDATEADYSQYPIFALLPAVTQSPSFLTLNS